MLEERKQTLVNQIRTVCTLEHLVRELRARKVSDTCNGPERVQIDRYIRGWSRSIGPAYASVAGAALGPKRSRGGWRGNDLVDIDHVVPVRCLVDRMINDPDEIEPLVFDTNITAMITKVEHGRLRPMGTENIDLYERILEAPLAELEAVGFERYSRAEVVVAALPPRTMPQFF